MPETPAQAQEGLARASTPDPEHVEAARAPRDNFVKLSLLFRYGLAQESAPRQHPAVMETLAFCFPADVPAERQIHVMEEALRAGGAVLPKSGLAGSFAGLDVAGRQWATATALIGSGQSQHWTVESEEKGVEAFAERAREIGRQAAEFSGGVVWRRVGDVAGARSAMHGLEMLCEEFQALVEANVLRASIAKPVAASKAPTL